MAEQRDGVWTWTHSDHLHSATVVTDATGAEIRRLSYRAFGEQADNSGPGDAPKYTYTAKEADQSGLMYYGARYYDPVLARFISADTLYDRGPQGLNRYSYVLNNPIIYNDLTGHYVNGPHDSNEPTGYGSITGSQTEGSTEYIHDGQGFNMPMSQFRGQLPSADPKSLESPYQGREVGSDSYVARSINQIARGNYSEDVTLLGTGGQVILGLSGLDLLADLRDAYYDVRHWQWTWGHAGQTGLDLVAFFPLIGMLKYGDEAGTLLKSSSKVSTTAKNLPALYDTKFAAKQLLDNGKISLDRVKAFVPNDSPNLFRPSNTIQAGQKYQFRINGTKVEVKFHSPDANNGSVIFENVKNG